MAGVDGLTRAMVLAAVLAPPPGAGPAVTAFTDPVGSAAAAVACLPRATYARLVSLLPTSATVIGIVVLTRIPDAREVAGVVLVVAGVAPHQGAHQPRHGADIGRRELRNRRYSW